MGFYGWLVIYVAGAIASPLLLLIAVLFVIAFVRTVRFKRKRGWLADRVPHTLLYEFYHCCSVDMDAQKILCILAEKGVEFKEHEIDIGFFGKCEQLEDRLLRVNPNGTQPTLVHDGHPVVGIEEIISYLEESVEGPAMLPASPEERKEVIRWIQTCTHAPVAGLNDDKGNPQWTLGMATRLLSVPVLSAATRPITFSHSLWAVWRHPNPLPEFGIIPRALTRNFRAAEGVPEKQVARLAFAVLSHSLDGLEKELAADGRQFLVGGCFSLADICMIATLGRLELLGILDIVLSDSRPRIRDYWERMKKRDSFRVSFRPKAVTPDLQELERAFARFRKEVADRGLVAAYKMDEDGEEEEED